MTAKKKPAPTKKKKLKLDKDTTKKLTDKELGDVGGGRPRQGGTQDSYRTCNMACNSDPSACGCF